MKKEHASLQLNLSPTQTADRQLPPGIARIYEVELFSLAIDQPNGWTFSEDVIRASLPKWANVEVMFDHPGMFEGPSASRLIGQIRAPHWEAPRLIGELHILNLQQSQPAIELLNLVVQMRAAGQPAPRVGMSADMWLLWDERGQERVVTRIEEIATIDVVVRPAAAGPIQQILMQQRPGASTMKKKCTQCGEEYDEGTEHTCPTHAQMSAQPVQPSDIHTAVNAALREADAQLQQQCAQLLNVKLSAAGLPTALADIVRARFETDGQARIFQPAELEAEITRAKAAHAQMSAQAAVQGMGHPAQDGRRRPQVSGMFDSNDRVKVAYERLMGLPIEARFSDVPRLTGIRELYIGLTGDRDMRGLYQPEHAQFAVTGATTPMTAAVLANITADVMSKLAMQSWNEWSMAGYGWWERVVAMKDFASLQDAKFVVLGGVANLSTVTEGNVYGELTIDDKKESFAFLKKGGYLPLTIEMIDKDDTESWRSAGAKLGVAAIRTLSASIASILTTNAALGEDSTTLFHANHSNLISYDIDSAGWDAAGQAIYAQTEVHSAKTLAIWPDRVVVPIQKRRKAVSLFFSDKEPGGSLNDVNVAAIDGTKDSNGPVIVCPELTSATDWYALCNPALQPALGVGFRFGRKPEVFSAADATSFMMFYQDTLPVKVRYFYAAGAIDYRGICKSAQ